MAVWDIIGFPFLLERHLVSDVSLAGQVMMVEVFVSSLHTLLETFTTILTRACIVPLRKTVARNLSLGKSRARPLVGLVIIDACAPFFFLKALPTSCVFLFIFVFYHSYCPRGMCRRVCLICIFPNYNKCRDPPGSRSPFPKKYL